MDPADGCSLIVATVVPYQTPSQPLKKLGCKKTRTDVSQCAVFYVVLSRLNLGNSTTICFTISKNETI